jgi:hypothetical protein
LLAAPGGVGKSSLAIGMSVAVATAHALLDEKIWQDDLKCLYFNGEDGGTEMRRRIWAFCRKHCLAEQDLGQLLVAGAEDWRVQRLSFLRTEKGNSLLDEAGLAHLELLLESLRPDLIVLDPLVAFCGGGNVNDNAVMSLVMQALKRLATRFDCAVLIIHHTRKGGDLSSAEAISGASAIVNLARRAIMTVPMTLEEAKPLGVLPSQRSHYFKVVAAKSNLAPRSDDSPWYELSSIELPNSEPPTYPYGDGVQAVARVKLPLHNVASTPADQTIKKAILDTVDRGKLIDGQSYPYSPNVTGAKNERALLNDAMIAVANATAPQQWDHRDLEVVTECTIAAMKSEGCLVDDEIRSGRFRRGRGLRVDWSRTPWADAASNTGTGPSEDAAGDEPDQQGQAGTKPIDPGPMVNGSMPRSMNDQLPKQGGGQLPPFKGGIDHPPPAPVRNNHPCSPPRIRATAAVTEGPSPTKPCITQPPHPAAVNSEVAQPPTAPAPCPTTVPPSKTVAAPPDLWDGLDIPPFLRRALPADKNSDGSCARQVCRSSRSEYARQVSKKDNPGQCDHQRVLTRRRTVS